MSTLSAITSPADRIRDHDLAPRLGDALAAAATLIPFALCSFAGASGSAITEDLVRDSGQIQIGAGVAVLVSALLVVSAVRLGRAVTGVAGAVITAAGVGTALLYAAYYASFGAGALVSTQMLEDPGAGIGEATALLVNITELTRFAPGLALVAAAVAARRVLPRAVWITAALLAVLTILPFTSWVAALLIPVWLGVSACFTSAVRAHV